MKAFLTLSLLVTLAVLHCSAELSTDERSKISAAKEKCKKENNISDESLREFKNSWSVPEGESGKCFVSCFLTELGEIVDGKLSLAKLQESNSRRVSDKAIAESLNNIESTCYNEVAKSNGSLCEIAAEYVNCKTREMKKNGVKYPSNQFKTSA